MFAQPMLIAIIDFLKYRLRRGRYSDHSLSAEGRLAVSSEFPNYMKYTLGDIFIYHRHNSFLSWLVMYFTDSVWSHVGNFIGHGQIIEATTSGVMKHDFMDYMDGSGYLQIRILKPALSAGQADKMNKFLHGKIGARFNWRGVLRLFTKIILGNHHHYDFKYSADFAILLSPFLFLGSINRWLMAIPTLIFIAYCFIVIRNRFIRLNRSNTQKT